ncbi:MAG: RNA polymerase sigma factor [Oscillospiraceae bacterium]
MDTMTLKADDSFDSVMEAYMPMVYRIAFTRLGNRPDAEDITQDVFVRLFRANVSFENEEHRKAWLIRCTVNCIKSFVASAWFRHRASDAGLENMCEEELETGVSSASAGFTEQSDRKNAVAEAVMKLPPKYRTVIHLFYFEDMSISDISRAISVKESTVKSQLSRARDMLRPMLEEVDF